MRFRYSTDEKGKLVKKALVYTENEHGIDFSDVDPQAVFIVGQLRASGYETYIVGGAVRDLILKKKPKDFDIVSSASPLRIKRVFRNSRIIGNRFRLVHVFFNNKIFEVSTFRSNKDGSIGNVFGTIEDDVLRRDFSVNALFYDPLKQVVVDFVGGMKDINAKRIRPVIPLSQIFTDDPVRMIRAVKYGVITGFKLPLSLRMKIKRQSSLLSSVSPSRLTEEIFKIINSAIPGQIVDELDKTGLFQYLQPRAASLFRIKQGFKERYIKTLEGLNHETENFGMELAGLIRDYLEDVADWKGSGEIPPRSLHERFKEAFIAARKFILPMNPPRIEFNNAVKLLFAEHGVVVKRSRFHDKFRKEEKPREEKLLKEMAAIPTAKPAVKPAAKPVFAENLSPELPVESAARTSAQRRKQRRRNQKPKPPVSE